MLRTRTNKTVTVLDTSFSGGEDRYGNELYDEVPTEYEGWVEQKAADELGPDRETRVSQWLLILPPEADIAATYRVEIDEESFEVIGDPVQVFNSRGLHHIEATLERYTG